MLTNAPVLQTVSPNPSYSGNITLFWGSPTGALSYNVYQNTSVITTLNGSLTKFSGIGATTWSDSLANNGQYYYVVTAVNTVGESSISNCLSANVQFLSISFASTMNIISPNPNYSGSIVLSWNTPLGSSWYYLYRSTTPITTVNGISFIANLTTNSYNDMIETEGTYYYAVIAGNLAGNSSLSNCVNITISVPITPIMNSILPNPSNTISVDLLWTNLGVGVNYYLYVSFSPLTTVNGLPFYENLTTNSFIDTVYSANTYYYAVMASREFGKQFSLQLR